MTVYLALDYISPEYDFPDGRIVAISRTQQGLADLGYGPTEGYTVANYRVRSVNEREVGNFPIETAPGWFWITGGHLQSVNLLFRGSGYTDGTADMVVSGTGQDARVTATVSGGEVTEVNIINPGHSYSASPLLSLNPSQVGTGSGLVVVATVSPLENKSFRSLPMSATQIARNQIDADATSLRESVLREAQDWEEVIARERFSPHTDSGHAWSDDLLHALIKPNIRGLVVLLTAAKANPSQAAINTYRARLDSFISIAENPGVINIYSNADKSVWRPLRTGAYAYGYDVNTGGIRTVDGTPGGTQIRFPVTYPDGETVATWDVLEAVEDM